MRKSDRERYAKQLVAELEALKGKKPKPVKSSPEGTVIHATGCPYFWDHCNFAAAYADWQRVSCHECPVFQYATTLVIADMAGTLEEISKRHAEQQTSAPVESEDQTNRIAELECMLAETIEERDRLQEQLEKGVDELETYEVPDRLQRKMNAEADIIERELEQAVERMSDDGVHAKTGRYKKAVSRVQRDRQRSKEENSSVSDLWRKRVHRSLSEVR